MMAEQKNSGLRPNAWLLDFGQPFRAAVGARVLLQLIDSPKLHPIPCTPQHCHYVFFWQERWLPVMDMASFLGGEPQALQLLAIAGYQEQPGEPTRFGAFLLSAPPVAIIVDNDQLCSLPEQPAGWDKFALSCFGHQSEAIPVLHLGRVFARPAGDYSY